MIPAYIILIQWMTVQRQQKYYLYIASTIALCCTVISGRLYTSKTRHSSPGLALVDIVLQADRQLGWRLAHVSYVDVKD